MSCRTKPALARDLTLLYARTKQVVDDHLSTPAAKREALAKVASVVDLTPSELPSALRNGHFDFFQHVRPPFTVLSVQQEREDIYWVSYRVDLAYDSERKWRWTKTPDGTFNNQLCGCAQLRIPRNYPTGKLEVLDWGKPQLSGFNDTHTLAPRPTPLTVEMTAMEAPTFHGNDHLAALGVTASRRTQSAGRARPTQSTRTKTLLRPWTTTTTRGNWSPRRFRTPLDHTAQLTSSHTRIGSRHCHVTKMGTRQAWPLVAAS
mmetsp:Transcript_78579/g.179834  ORF Transcript_78579/g.179834 Transcript_78579/m.179834 type:complete len:261 (+) Transcript_78579:79-861(+)